MSAISNSSTLIKPRDDGAVTAVNNYVRPVRVTRNVSANSSDYAEIAAPLAALSKPTADPTPAAVSSTVATTTTIDTPRLSAPSLATQYNGTQSNGTRSSIAKTDGKAGGRCCGCASWKARLILLGILELFALSYHMMSSIIIHTKDRALAWYLQPILAPLWVADTAPFPVLIVSVAVIALGMLAVICLLQALDSDSSCLLIPHLIAQVFYFFAMLGLVAYAIYRLSVTNHFDGLPSVNATAGVPRNKRQTTIDSAEYYANYGGENVAPFDYEDDNSSQSTLTTITPFYPSGPDLSDYETYGNFSYDTYDPASYGEGGLTYFAPEEPTTTPPPIVVTAVAVVQDLWGWEAEGTRGQGVFLIIGIFVCMLEAAILAALFPPLFRVYRRLRKADGPASPH